MSENLFELFTTQFSTNLELRLQQTGSLLRMHVKEGFHVGKQASPIQQVGPISLKAPAGRFAPLNRSDSEFTRRWVFPQDGEIEQLIDEFDLLKTIIDPKSMYVESAANAVGRGWDDAIIANATGSNQIGTDAGSLSPETFDTTKFQIAINFKGSSTSGLTVAKMIEARRILRHYHNNLEMDPPVMVIGSQQEADLLSQVQVVSTEYNDRPVLVDGKVKRVLGVDIVCLERVPQSTVGSVRGCVAWVKSGIYLGIWQDMTNRISIANWLSSEPWDLYTKAMFGATRTQPGKVIQVLCADTTGTDVTP